MVISLFSHSWVHLLCLTLAVLCHQLFCGFFSPFLTINDFLSYIISVLHLKLHLTDLEFQDLHYVSPHFSFMLSASLGFSIDRQACGHLFVLNLCLFGKSAYF